MVGDGSAAPDSSLPALRYQLEEARRGLLGLHKALLDAERAEYEGEHGRIERNTDFLRLAIRDSRFAWLRPFLAFVVQIDEWLAADGPPTADDAAALLAQAREFLRPDEHGDAFQQRYYELLQSVPAVVIAHGEALRRLPRPPGKTPA